MRHDALSLYRGSYGGWAFGVNVKLHRDFTEGYGVDEALEKMRAPLRTRTMFTVPDDAALCERYIENAREFAIDSVRDRVDAETFARFANYGFDGRSGGWFTFHPHLEGDVEAFEEIAHCADDNTPADALSDAAKDLARAASAIEEAVRAEIKDTFNKEAWAEWLDAQVRGVHENRLYEEYEKRPERDADDALVVETTHEYAAHEFESAVTQDPIVRVTIKDSRFDDRRVYNRAFEECWSAVRSEINDAVATAARRVLWEAYSRTVSCEAPK